MAKEKTVQELTNKINEYVNKGMSHIDAVIEYCNDTGHEIEVVAKAIMMNGNIVSKIEMEAEELNMIPKTSRLPFPT